MPKFVQGKFSLKNPEKYVGTKTPTYRSSWEWTFMKTCDEHPSIHQWASESIKIPYRDPTTGKQTIYVPDFLIQYRNRNNQVITELIEIKPKKQSLIESKASDRDRAIVAVNYAKWDAATKWAKRNGLVFRVINEDMIYHQGGKK